ncbi:hypothetical protein D3C76_1767770 [compost metagenome]
MIRSVQNENMNPISRTTGMAAAAEVMKDNRTYIGPRQSSPVIMNNPRRLILEPRIIIRPEPIM